MGSQVANIWLIGAGPARQARISLPTPGRMPQEWSRMEIQFSLVTSVRSPFSSTQPSAVSHLVIPQHVVRHPVAVGTAIGHGILQCLRKSPSW